MTTVLFAAGGTGGHVFPALAVARALQRRRPDARIHFVGGRRGIEGRLVPAAGFSLSRLPAAGLRGASLAGKLRFGAAFVVAALAAVFLILRLRPRLILATGGYASAAPALVAALLGRELWLQEQNSVPGSTNRLLARFARRAFIAFEEARSSLTAAGSVERLPNPVRSEIRASRQSAPRPDDFAALGLEPGRRTLLVFGGSRGAATLNRAVREGWPQLSADTDWQLLVQTGSEEARSTQQALQASGAARFCVQPFLQEMDRAYRVADLVVCRAGALTLAELSAVGKAALLVPFPYATDDHQTRNARVFEAAGAARLARDAEFGGDLLARHVRELSADPAALASMAARALEVDAGLDGAEELAARMIDSLEASNP